MSTLLKQVAEPQSQSTPKNFRKPKPTDPHRSPVCKCGGKKMRRSTRCLECRGQDRKPPIDPSIFFMDGQPCRRVSLTRGQYMIVEAEDYDRISQFSCHAQWRSTNKCFYAMSSDAMRVIYNKRGSYSVAALMLGLPPGTLVDHINGNGLDNRRCNLRPATRSQNGMNQPKHKNNTSGYKGVSWYPKTKRWKVQIGVNRRVIHLGFRVDIKEAARLYDKAAKKYFGKFARTNAMEGLL